MESLRYYIMPVLYVLLFFCGFCGNLWVIIILVRRLYKQHRHHQRSSGSGDSNQIIIYVLCLSIADFCVTLGLPFLLSDLHYGEWRFGEPLCKLFWANDHIHKFLSVGILTLLSFDRYLTMCGSVQQMQFIRKPSVVASILAVFCGVIALMQLPILISSELQYFEFELNSTATYENGTRTKNTTKVSINVTKCSEGMPESWALGFVVYIFILSFCLPGFLITFCYCRILLVLKSTAHSSVHSSIPVKQVARRVLALILFYFFCWTPYWTYAWLTLLIHHLELDVGAMNTIAFLGYLFTSMPYVNSAANWIFYALLNQKVRNQRQPSIGDSARNGKMTHNRMRSPAEPVDTSSERQGLLLKPPIVVSPDSEASAVTLHTITVCSPCTDADTYVIERNV